MCLPAAAMPAAIATLGIAESVTGYAGLSQAAKDAQNEMNRRYRGVSSAAISSYFHTLEVLHQREDQVTAEAVQAAQENKRQLQSAKASASTGAAARGIGGNTVAALLAEFDAIEAENAQTLATNLRWQRQQIREEERGAFAQAANLIAQAAPSQVRRPSPVGVVLGVAGSFMSAAEFKLRYGAP